MGYDSLAPNVTTAAPPDEPLWKLHRYHFPNANRMVYLNHAGVSPLCRPSAGAMNSLTEDALEWGSAHYSQWLDAYEGLRGATARLIGAHRDEIAIVKNTSEGISTVALGLDWRAGDRIVCFREEFPANFFPWLRLEPRGVQITWLSETDSLDRIDEACRGARLLAVSFVNYLSGRRMDLEALGEICGRHGTFFFVDAIQGLGAFPVDVRRAGIHALAADGHKWLLGPEGCGVLYVAREMLDQVQPVEFGWSNIAGYNDFGCRDMTLRPDAGRYECGTLNTVGVYGLRAAMEFVLAVGVEAIGPAVQALADRVADGVAQKGYEVLGGARTAATGAGIVSFRRDDTDSRVVVRTIKDQRFVAAPRQGWVRVSPHFYQRPDEMDALVAALP